MSDSTADSDSPFLRFRPRPSDEAAPTAMPAPSPAPAPISSAATLAEPAPEPVRAGTKPLKDSNSLSAFELHLLNGGTPASFDEEHGNSGGGEPDCAGSSRFSSSTTGAAPPGAWVLAALNFNAKRVPFSPFDEAADGKLGSVYTRVTETLLARGDWVRKAALRNKATGELKLPSTYALMLGTAQGKGVPWGRLGYGVWPPPLVNYMRGFDMLTRKGKMAATLETAKEDFGGTWPTGMPDVLKTGACVRSDDVWELAPCNFVFHPSKGEANRP